MKNTHTHTYYNKRATKLKYSYENCYKYDGNKFKNFKIHFVFSLKCKFLAFRKASNEHTRDYKVYRNKQYFSSISE